VGDEDGSRSVSDDGSGSGDDDDETETETETEVDSRVGADWDLPLVLRPWIFRDRLSMLYCQEGRSTVVNMIIGRSSYSLPPGERARYLENIEMMDVRQLQFRQNDHDTEKEIQSTGGHGTNDVMCPTHGAQFIHYTERRRRGCTCHRRFRLTIWCRILVPFSGSGHT
jgi:hypothetical protein